jgi:hypothetical protein
MMDKNLIDRPAGPVERMRASKQAYEEQQRLEGHEAGIAFATNKADYEDLLVLRAVAANDPADDELFDTSTTSNIAISAKRISRTICSLMKGPNRPNILSAPFSAPRLRRWKTSQGRPRGPRRTDAAPALWAGAFPLSKEQMKMKWSDLKEGMVVYADDGFTCLREGPHIVKSDDGGFYLDCDEGTHHLDAQLDEEGYVVGLTAAPEA